MSAGKLQEALDFLRQHATVCQQCRRFREQLLAFAGLIQEVLGVRV